jgi:Domain of unknown function (DUF4189)
MKRMALILLALLLAIPHSAWAQGSVNEDANVRRQKDEVYERDQQQLYEQQQASQAAQQGYQDQNYSKPRGPKWVDSYGTAVWRTDGEHGFWAATNYTSKGAADKAALKLCKDAGYSCAVARRVVNGMILGIRDANGNQLIVSAPNLSEAREPLDAYCKKNAVECYVTSVFESQPWQDNWGKAKDAISHYGPYPDSYAAVAWTTSKEPKWADRIWPGSNYKLPEDARSFALRECEAATKTTCEIAREIKNGFIIATIDSMNAMRVNSGPNLTMLKKEMLERCAKAGVTCGPFIVVDSIKG